MQSADIILATGGPGMVKSAYSSGKPALGVGPGNTPAVIDESADILLAVNSIIHSKTFDNGMICASEQSVIVLDSIYDKVRNEFLKRNCYILNPEETEKSKKNHNHKWCIKCKNSRTESNSYCRACRNKCSRKHKNINR